MKVTLPSSPLRHYLSGMDWVVHAIDHTSKKFLGCGLLFQIVVELAGTLEKESFRASLARYCECFPHLWGVARRDFINLAPYWRMNRERGDSKVEVAFRQAVDFEEALNLLSAELNTPFEREEICFKVFCVTVSDKTLIGFTFDHRLFDARGAESFLQGFHDWAQGLSQEFQVRNADAGLDHWREKFEAGRKVKRAGLASGENTRVRHFTDRTSPIKGKNRFKIKHFDQIATQSIFARADKRAGLFMFLPYSLAISIQMIHALFVRRGQREGDFVISVTRDMRVKGSSKVLMLFNHFSVIYFRVAAPEIDDFQMLAGRLKQQLYEQVKNKLPEALSESSMLIRIVPRSVLSYGFEAFTPTPMPTFVFGFLGESAYQSDEFAGLEVLNMFHLPRIPPSPGLGIFFSQYRSRLAMTLSYIEGTVSEEEAEDLILTVAEQL